MPEVLEVRNQMEETLDLLKMTAELLTHMDKAANRIQRVIRKGGSSSVGARVSVGVRVGTKAEVCVCVCRLRVGVDSVRSSTSE